MIKQANDSTLKTAHELLEFYENQRFLVRESDSESENELINHDLDLRPNNLFHFQKQYLVSLGQHRPKLTQFPQD